MAVGTLVFDKSSYENVVCLGHILAEDGRKMSKHLGNILEPIPLMDQHGADAVRWFMAAGGSPWAARRVGHGTIQEVVRKTLLTYWNTVAFQALYARTSELGPVRGRPGPGRPPGPGPLAAVRAARARATRSTQALEAYDTQRAGKLAVAVRRRPVELVRAPLPAPLLAGRHGGAAHAARRRRDGHPLMAPLTPFITERVLAGPGGPGDPGRPRVRPPDLAGPRRTCPRSTRRCRRRWRSSAGWWSWAVPRARSRA